jgi:hypothetical protein
VEGTVNVRDFIKVLFKNSMVLITDDVYLLGGNIDAIKKNIETKVDSSKEMI